MKFIGKAINGQLCFNRQQMALRTEYLRKFKSRTVAEQITILGVKNKTKEQLGAWWGLLARTILAEFEARGYDTSYIFRLDTPTGIPVSNGLLKEYLYTFCPIYRDNNRITMSQMTTSEMAQFFDSCRNFAASQWGIYVPEPDPNYKQEDKDVRKRAENL